MRGVQPNILYVNASARVTSSAGIQTFSDIITIASVDRQELMFGAVFNENNSTQIVVESIKTISLFTNQEPGIVILKIYDVTCEQSTLAANGPTGVFTGVASDAGVANGCYYPNASPDVFPGFRALWKLDKCTTVTMQPGQVHRHEVYDKLDVVVNAASIKYGPNASTGFTKGLSRAQMAVYYGAPYNDSTTKTSATTTTGLATIDWVATSEYTFKFLSNQNVDLVLIILLPPLLQLLRV
jgi:hypothetical protein